MKIIHLLYADSGGGHNAVYRVHQALLKKKIDSQMWVINSKLDDNTIKQPLNVFQMKVIKFFLFFAKNFIVRLMKTKNLEIHSVSFFSSSFLKKINNSDADVVNLHWIQGEMLSIKDISKIKKPIVWTLHDMWAFCGAEHYTEDNRWQEGYNFNNRPSYEGGFDLNRWTWKRKRKYWKKEFQIVTPSKWLASCVSKSALMKDWPVSVIPNPIDADLWKPMDKYTAKKKLNLPSNVPLILFGAMGGGRNLRKGFDLLLQSLKKLKNNSTSKNLELIVFGQNKTKSQSDIAFPIHYIGHLSNNKDLQAAYSAADVMVVPSRQDNLPNTAIEAQACGAPVVAFDVGGLSDIIIHKKTGYLAKKFDTSDLAHGINWVLNQQKIKRLGINARIKAVEKFSEKKISENYLNIYKKVLTN